MKGKKKKNNMKDILKRILYYIKTEKYYNFGQTLEK